MQDGLDWRDKELNIEDMFSFATKDEVAKYLRRFVEKNNIPIRVNEEVLSLSQREGGEFVIKTSKSQIIASQVLQGACIRVN